MSEDLNQRETGQVAPFTDATCSGSETPRTDELSFIKPTHSMWREAHEELERENNQLRAAIQKAVNEFAQVRWGWDGDCGSGMIIERLEDSLSQNDQSLARRVSGSE